MRLEDLAKEINQEKPKPTAKINQQNSRRPWLELDEPIKKGPLKKPENKLIQTEKRLERIEIKTEKLLKKAEAKTATNNAENTHKSPIIQQQSPHRTKRDASYFTYVCLPPRKLPRKILDHVKRNAFFENGEWYSRIDSYELSSEANIKSHQISNTVRQLRDEGFYEIIEASSSGYRLLKIDPEIFGIKNPT